MRTYGYQTWLTPMVTSAEGPMHEPAANAPETETKPSRGLGSYVVWGFVVVALLYVLSSGPAWRLSIKFNDLRYLTIYKPLIKAASDVKSPFRRPLIWYWHIWCPEQFQ
jgi:hypothetical protein